MIFDYLLQFTGNAGQTITAAKESDFVLDFSQVAPSTGHNYGDPFVVFAVKTAVTGKIEFKLQDCDKETGGTWTDLVSTGEIDAPAAGSVFYLKVPYRHRRYLRVYFGGPSAGGPTAGAVFAAIAIGPQDNVAPEQAESISNVF